MRIGIIGSGNMGRTLGLLWAAAGHEVFFGARNLEDAQAAAARSSRSVGHGSNDEAASFGEVALWTVRDVNASEVLNRPTALDGKIVIDPNNGPLPADFTLGPGPGLLSHAERLAVELPRARVIKAFNTAAQEIFNHSPPTLRAHRVSAFLAGDDVGAKRVVAKLAEDMGLVPVDAGPLRAAGMLEGLGDFIRYMMGVDHRGPYTTISVEVLPAASSRFGGRTATRLK
ncbi:NADPH-dependent F420 reductase [Pendulispora albinea]|uniref:NAD(P)-binding domain-containing protein n=1 Tax=Pendulispora albinea TaxID=2741071 RepID=A0ABZ2M672_9BACT